MKKANWQLTNTYLSLPDKFYQHGVRANFANPKMVIFNQPLADDLGLPTAQYSPDEWAAFLTGNQFLPSTQPIALAYAGHQFGHFNRLGDGRALLIGEQTTPTGERIDIQLKGSGRTAYSRRGDGKAALSPMLREYLISEAMFALGVPTTRSLAVATTGEQIYREHIAQGAVLTRTAQSHLRVGSFEFAAAFGQDSDVKALADYAIMRHFPSLASLPKDTRYQAMLNAIIARQASLIAKWQHIGFIHGVMNSDNMAISGETIDYGPCAFIDFYDPKTVFSSIDQHGRYRYDNQPAMGQWNLARLAKTLLPLLSENANDAIAIANEAVANFMTLYRQYDNQGMKQKLGLAHTDGDQQTLIDELLALMATHQADFTHTFARLTLKADGQDKVLDGTSSLFDSTDFLAWQKTWQARLDPALSAKAMKQVNPYIIARNFLVEEALSVAELGDMSIFLQLLSALQTPFDYDNPNHRSYQKLPSLKDSQCHRTFCGT